MAHGDYNCCAVCDSKMDYNARDARTKEDICTECLKGLRDAGINALDVDELMAWIAAQPAAVVLSQLATVGFSPCFYANRLDLAVESKAEASPVNQEGE